MGLLRRVLRVSGTVISLALVAIIAGVIVLAVAQRRATNGVPVVAGREVLTVLSGSMTPTIDTGDVVVDRSVTAAAANHLHVGQIVTYALRGRSFDGGPMLITHRIVGVFTVTNKATGRAQRLYVTKGDANNVVDPQAVAPSQIVGLYAWRIPYGGYVSSFIHTPLGFAIFIGLPILYLVGGEFLTLWRRLDEQDRREASSGQRPEPAAEPVPVPAGPGEDRDGDPAP